MMKIKGSKNKIVCEGSLIFDNANDVKESLLLKLEKLNVSKPVSIDLSQVEEIDSSGLQLLLSFFKTMDDRSMQYKVVSVNDEMIEILNLSGLSKFFRLEV
ncbi:MAG: STAS domain-containing protein [bacterium]|nr:STAS domain-containing protein [bacterium]